MELKDWLNSVNFTKEDLSEDMKSYPPYIVNRCLSGHLDCVLFANEMNKYHFLDKDMQYKFYLNSLRKKRDFLPGSVRTKSRISKVSNNTMVIVMRRHVKLLKILTQEQINFIKKRLDVGGTK